MNAPDVQKLGRVDIRHGANGMENDYALYWRSQGARLRPRYFLGRHFKSVGSGGDYAGPNRNKKPGPKTYNPELHARTILAGGRRRHLGVAA